MTAINLAVQPRRRAAYLISDCAWTRPDGTVEKIAGKIIAFERFPCAIGVTGNVDPLALGEAAFALGARNLATLLRGLPGILRAALGATAERYPGTAEPFGVLKVAAWDSRKACPRGFIMGSDDVFARFCIGDDWRAFEVAECSSSLGTDNTLSDLLGRPGAIHEPESFDPHEDAFALVAAQRRRPILCMNSEADQSAPFRIGGEVELTEVSRRGVRVWSCGTFPDYVGHLIEPTRDHTAPSHQGASHG